ncbi:Xaa-Pro peptidase family protein [Paracoccaceae bacterium]|nr:Xaa-Pro peptidase family protein [Paracoccaceae bacterium]
MELDSLINRQALYKARLNHTREGMRRHDIHAMLIVDPNQIFYSTGAMNMQLWSTRTPARYLLILLDGPVILFDFAGSQHLAETLPTISEIRKAEGLDFISSGGDPKGANRRFAKEIFRTIRNHDIAIDQVAVDRFPFLAIDALRNEGLEIIDAHEALALTRMIKLPIELPYIREAMRRVESGVERLENKAEPGKTETETWAEFHYELMAKGGKYVSTRLFQSGPNTFPYFQEAGNRLLEKGNLLCLDTDALAFENYAVDFSRTFLCGDKKATSEQKLLYGRAREQLEWNASLLKPGIAYRELAEKAWTVPEEHQASRYYCIGHGLGMAGEFPNIPHMDDTGSNYPLLGHLEPGMIICLESYIGWERSQEGVKLEDQFLIREDRVERMSNYHFDDRLG